MNTKKLCPNCKKNPAVIHKDYGVLPCNSCNTSNSISLGQAPEFYSINKQERVQADRDHNARDMIQPYDHKGKINPEFVKAFPGHAKEWFGEDELSKL